MPYRNIISPVIGALVIIFVLLIFQGRAIAQKLDDLKLLPRPETFTELYLLNHQSIPYTITPNQEVSFQFAIHNLENKDINYPFEIYLLVDGKKQPLVKNSILVKDNQTKIVKESLSVNYSSKKFEIGVNLINKNQSVDFWVEE